MRRFLWAACFAPFLLIHPDANADEKDAEQCLRAKIWSGYEQGWAVRTATTTSLEKDSHRVYLVTLYEGNEYKFQVCGDKNANNLDLILHDDQGKEIQRDKSTDREPMLTFKPKATQTYYIAVYAANIAKDVEAAGVALAVTYK
jgi:hypothetical protein